MQIQSLGCGDKKSEVVQRRLVRNPDYKFRQIGVPTRDSFSSHVLKVCNQSRVEARYWKPKIGVSRSTITSPVWTCSNIIVHTQVLICEMTFISQNARSSDSNITWVELLPPIGLNIRTRIIADYWVFLE